MNLEKELHSWQPRRPAAKIKARLFPERERRQEFVRVLRWFAPTAACGLIALAALGPDNLWHSLKPGRRPVSSFTGQAISALEGVTINRSPDFFEWTNRSGSALNVRSFLPGTTN